jgi:ankyrin repeat protein
MDKGHKTVAEQLIDYGGCDVDIVVPSTGRTPLLMCVLQCKADLVGRLIKRGADPNTPDKQRDRALHAALRLTGML